VKGNGERLARPERLNDSLDSTLSRCRHQPWLTPTFQRRRKLSRIFGRRVIRATRSISWPRAESASSVRRRRRRPPSMGGHGGLCRDAKDSHRVIVRPELVEGRD
jgi:hypothetical protein